MFLRFVDSYFARIEKPSRRRRPQLNRRRLHVEGLEDRRLLAVVTVQPAASPTAIDNDYTRIDNAVQAAVAGDVIKLKGTFDWTEANAAASWSRGSDDIAGTIDDYSVYVPANLNNVTITANSLGQATIKGPGDVPTYEQESVFVFDGGDNQNWTISNLRIVDFDLSIGFFNGAGGVDAFNNTKIVNNYIHVATDLFADVTQNIGIHYSFGVNQTFKNNTIVFNGDGLSDPVDPAEFAQSVGMQSNTSGGAVYDGLKISDNTFLVLKAQSSNPEHIVGIWENGHAHESDITISGNEFKNLAKGNDPSANEQEAFRVTSHSSATTTVVYSGNKVNGANVGIEWLDLFDDEPDFVVTHPVKVTDNDFKDVFTSVLVQDGGFAEITGNKIDGLASGGAGVVVLDAPTRARIIGNSIGGSFVGIKVDAGTALIQDNDLNKNSNAGLLIVNAGIVDAGQTGVGVNFTGLGVSSGNNDFKHYKHNSSAKAIRNLNTGAPYSSPGSNGLPFDVMAQNNRFHKTDLAFIESVVEHDADNALLGLVNYSNPKKGGGSHGGHGHDDDD